MRHEGPDEPPGIRAEGEKITVLDAFSLSQAEWEEVELLYESCLGLTAEEMLVRMLQGAGKEQQKFLALGIMVGRQSICPQA